MALGHDWRRYFRWLKVEFKLLLALSLLFQNLHWHMHFLDHLIWLWNEHFDGIWTLDGHSNFVWNFFLDNMGNWNVDGLFHVMFRVNWNLV